MRKILLAAVLFLVTTNFATAQITPISQHPIPTTKAKMQVVFALDATGSMSGLMTAAKDKIWSIVNSLTQIEGESDIQVGIIFYRDRGDAFVTKKIALTDSMDYVYGELMKIKAQGGGDGPESVNQGLNEAVEQFAWDKDTATYKTIFLVGDYEPHMDYKNDVPYYVSCKIAKQKDIVLNTILMGNNAVAKKVWEQIATCNNGAYVNVNMNVNDIAIATPHDSVIAVLNDKLDDYQYYYGSAKIKSQGFSAKVKAKEVAGGSKVNVKAQRAEYNAYKNKKIAFAKTKNNEIISDFDNGLLMLDTLSQTALPDEFKHMPKDTAIQLIKQKVIEKKQIEKQLQEEMAKRNKYIEVELSKKDAKEVSGSFNSIIYENIKTQTTKKKIVLKGKAKY